MIFNNSNKSINSFKSIGYKSLAAIFLSISITGCQVDSHTTKSEDSVVTPLSESPTTYTSHPVQEDTIENNNNSSNEGEVTNCQRELLALSKIDQTIYAQKKKSFEDLLSGASIYTSVRNDIDIKTKNTIDALYKFKTQNLCSDIEQSVRQALISRGDVAK
ncbi:hypothetical protein [Lelliottia sp. WAP21]|uniref:hypothetical protein n=1 Tax=Lelliottia sp. WAP21 TaxID=2877426 RepID=UPI001E2E3FD4|nr:hypothetical protein [Lelliottia sp. WAP21]